MRKLVVSEAVTVDGVFGQRENAGRTMKTKVIGYWVTTVILIFVMVSGAVGELTHNWGTLETVTILGYPLYLLTIVGVWKVAGAIALLVPGFPRLKEWAYAGIFFNMTGAAVSHAAVGDYGAYGFHLTVPLIFAGLAVASWALRPPSRTLGVLFPAKTRA
jgi:uncharacterized membrane protein YphA (DoxX/SURF4 family)